MIGSHPKPLTRCFDKTMGLALWKMSGVLIVTEVEIKAFVIPPKKNVAVFRVFFFFAEQNEKKKLFGLVESKQDILVLNGQVLVPSLVVFFTAGPYLCASGRSDKVHYALHEPHRRTRLQQPRSKLLQAVCSGEGIPGQKCHNGHELK